jgi:hypothetical protein
MKTRPLDERMWLDVPDAARLVGFSPLHFRRIYIEAGGRFIKIGRKLFILASDLNERMRAEKTWAK